MVTTKIKFTATKDMPSYNGMADGAIINYSADDVERLMKDYPGCFEFIETQRKAGYVKKESKPAKEKKPFFNNTKSVKTPSENK